MLVIKYGSADIGRTRFASSPLLNLVMGLMVNRDAKYRTRIQKRWWSSRRRLIPAGARPLVELVNAVENYAPGFLMPDAIGDTGRFRRSLDEELDVLRAAPEDYMAQDLALYDSRVPPGTSPRILNDMRAQGASVLPKLVDAAQVLFRTCLADDWRDLERRMDAEVARRGQQLAAVGTIGVLNTLHPRLHWQDDVLTFVTRAEWPELVSDPGGRGLVLIPNLMGNAINTLLSDGRQPLLSYHPGDLAVEVTPITGDGVLSELIGVGRARALRAIGAGLSTGELAMVLGIGAPAASAHAATLRSAGLVVTVREGRSVRHSLTELGRGLLAANPR